MCILYLPHSSKYSDRIKQDLKDIYEGVGVKVPDTIDDIKVRKNNTANSCSKHIIKEKVKVIVGVQSLFYELGMLSYLHQHVEVFSDNCNFFDKEFIKYFRQKSNGSSHKILRQRPIRYLTKYIEQLKSQTSTQVKTLEYLSTLEQPLKYPKYVLKVKKKHPTKSGDSIHEEQKIDLASTQTQK